MLYQLRQQKISWRKPDKSYGHTVRHWLLNLCPYKSTWHQFFLFSDLASYYEYIILGLVALLILRRILLALSELHHRGQNAEMRLNKDEKSSITSRVSWITRLDRFAAESAAPRYITASWTIARVFLVSQIVIVNIAFNFVRVDSEFLRILGWHSW